MGMEGFAVATGPTADYGASLTFSVIITCVMAASGGLIFGYDIGISGQPSESIYLSLTRNLTLKLKLDLEFEFEP
jgi:hypothetical protein